MSAQMIVELPDGAKVYFGDKPATGLGEVGIAEKIATVGGDNFKAALGSLASLVAALEESVGKMTRRPDKIEMEFGASLTGDCNLWVVAGEGKAEFKVKLAWNKGKWNPHANAHARKNGGARRISPPGPSSISRPVSRVL